MSSKWETFKRTFGLKPGKPEPVPPPVPKIKFTLEPSNRVRVYVDLTVEYVGEGRLTGENAQNLGAQYGKLMIKAAEKATKEVGSLRIVSTNVDVTPEPEL